MREQKTSQLLDKRMAVTFYEQRYARGYMDEWPEDKKRRVFEIIRGLDLPDVGEALDFGCGNGVFTDVVRQALPAGWKVYGTDISPSAIENAGKWYPGCVFFLADDSNFVNERFDLLFTHHVLEHVSDLPQVLQEITDRAKTESTVLHILPCGNDGSLEHSICLLRRDGINRQLENRFFFEDEGHVRRLTTEQLSRLCDAQGFVLAGEYYSNQYYGAIEWITHSGPGLLRSFLDVSAAVDEKAKAELKRLRRKFFVLWALRYPAAFVDARLRKRSRTVREYVFLLFGLLLYAFAKPMDVHLKRKALDEWNRRSRERNGSEMYLIFKRQRTSV